MIFCNSWTVHRTNEFFLFEIKTQVGTQLQQKGNPVTTKLDSKTPNKLDIEYNTI